MAQNDIIVTNKTNDARIVSFSPPEIVLTLARGFDSQHRTSLSKEDPSKTVPLHVGGYPSTAERLLLLLRPTSLREFTAGSKGCNGSGLGTTIGFASQESVDSTVSSAVRWRFDTTEERASRIVSRRGGQVDSKPAAFAAAVTFAGGFFWAISDCGSRPG